MSKLIVVANRLPVQWTGSSWEPSPGGLVSAVAPMLEEKRGAWVGWTGIAGPAPKPFTQRQIRHVAVPLSEEEVDNYYLGFCNETVWPLYHDAIRTPEFHRHWWRPYVEVNRRFARAAARLTQPGDVVWVHDYQLQLVPAMLRELRPDARIGFFLHIPFPPMEIYARLPWRQQIVGGLLGADVIAFQTRLAKQNFARAAARFAGATGTTAALRYQGRQIDLQRAPISIDTKRYERLATDPAIREEARLLRKEMGEHKTIVLGVDRLDYTKGIDVRLRAFEALLNRQPDRAADTTFVQVAVPSRGAIIQYAEMRERIEQLVGRINGDHAPGAGSAPVHYLYRSLEAAELIAYYLAADVMMVTPLRDGMNLVAKEYVATRTDNTGVLMLSEFAGAAQDFRQAILVNPYDLDGVGDGLAAAVGMPPEEQRRRMAAMRRTVRRFDVHDWARTCLEALDQ